MSARTHEFDELICYAAQKWLSGWDWMWWLAQIIAESNLNPKAVSEVGAEGLPQLMPRTRAQLYAELKFPPQPNAFDPKFAVEAGAYYMHKLRRTWWMDRTEDERRRLAQASYNAGVGNILKAQKLAGGATAYASIVAKLPLVTGAKNAAQTREYVERIERIYHALKGEANASAQ